MGDAPARLLKEDSRMAAPLSITHDGSSFAAEVRKSIAFLCTVFAVGLGAGTAAAQSTGPHSISVPLTDPARPARVQVALLTGSIKVSGYSGKEIVVDTRARDGSDEDEDREERSHDSKSRG